MKIFLKLLTLWAFVINSAFGQGDPAPFVKGMGSTGLGNSASTILVPNNQSTKINAYQALIETGNTNILVNSGFEHSIPTTGWTLTNATASADTTNQVEGKKALSLSLTGALSVVQDSTINAANLVGLQGVARIKIKTSDVDGLQVCARNAGVTQTSLCINIPKDGAWKEINIPYILTATSNGIAITSTGTTGTVKLDDGFVGTSAPFQNVNGAKLVGAVTITGCAATWSTASTTFASYATQTGCTYTTSGQALAPSTNIPAIKFASLSAGDYRLEYEGTTQAANSNLAAYYQFSDGTNTARETSAIFATSSSVASNTLSQSITYSTAQSNITLEIKGKADSGGTNRIYGTTTFPATIKVWYFPPESKIYSQASQDYDWTAYTPTSPNSAFGTISNTDCYHKRDGSDLLLRCKFVSGTPAAVEARLSLPNSLISSSSSISQTQLAGNAERSTTTSATGFTVLMEPNTSYLTFGITTTSGTSPISKITASTSFSSGDIITFNARVPIQGWQDYGVIVGSFAGIEKCANDYECTDTFSAQVSSTGVVSNENIDWINGNCTNTSIGNYSCTLLTTLKDGTSAISSAMNCVATPNFSGVFTAQITGSSATSVAIQITNASAASSQQFTLKCQKGTNDYKPKTAKVASSIGVPTVPGVTTSAIDTFSFNFGTTNATTNCTVSPCSYLDQIGSAIISVTRSSTGQYTMNTSKTYSKLKCTDNLLAAGTSFAKAYELYCTNCSSISFATVSNTQVLIDSHGKIS